MPTDQQTDQQISPENEAIAKAKMKARRIQNEIAEAMGIRTGHAMEIYQDELNDEQQQTVADLVDQQTNESRRQIRQIVIDARQERIRRDHQRRHDLDQLELDEKVIQLLRDGGIQSIQQLRDYAAPLTTIEGIGAVYDQQIRAALQTLDSLDD